MTPAQVRAARGLLGWPASELASRAGMAPQTLSAYETEAVRAHAKTRVAIRRALEAAGVTFIDNRGVTL